MKIAVNTRLLLKDQMDGIGCFTFETFKIIVKNNPNHEFVFIFDRVPHPDFIFAENVTYKVISPQARHPLLYKIWYQFSLPKLLKKLNADVFIGTDGMIPLITDTRTLSAIHDINFYHHPEFLPKKYAVFYNKYFKSFAQKANRIATVSEYSKKDICKNYQINQDKVDVVYNGVNKKFTPIKTEEKVEVRNKYTEGKPYFLFVGTIHPRKNLINLFKAFDQFKSKTNSDFKLLIAGKKMWWKGEIENTFNTLKYKNDIIFIGRVNEEELPKIYAAATALTYIPFFEGFGIPIIEAMSCGTPVISSNTTSMPEVVEEAGILVNPTDVNEISSTLETLYNNASLLDNYSQKGIEQVKKFSWERTANLLWESILKTVNA